MSKSTEDASAVWSKENRYHLHEEGVQHLDTNTSSAPQDTQQQQQPSSQQHSNVEQPLGGDPTAQLEPFLASWPQISSTPYQQQQQPSSQQHSNVEQPFDGDPTARLAAVFANDDLISSTPYQQQPQRVFGQLLPIIGPNQFVLDEEFRAAAKKSPMLWAFMQAVDQAEKEQQEQVEELH
jgi:hypothetical protein